MIRMKGRGMQDTVGTPVTGSEAIKMNGHGRLGFSLDEYRRRYEVVLGGMAALGVDVLLVRGPENITYLTGYETPGYYKYHCLIVAPGEEPVLVLRRFEELNIPEYSWLTRHVPVDDWEHAPDVTVRTLRDMGLDDKRIGVEKAGWFFTVEEYETLRTSMPKAGFVDATARSTSSSASNGAGPRRAG